MTITNSQLRKWSLNAVYSIMGMIFFLAFMWQVLLSAEREDAKMEEIRQERCGKFGEEIPKQWRSYCNNTGS
jgi:hypothetical protein